MERTKKERLIELEKLMTNLLEIELQQAAKYVRKTFFPNWDKEQEWKFLECSEYLLKKTDRGADGECNIKEKTIKINMKRIAEYPTEDPHVLYDLLIHEICHCDTKGHEQDWQDAMLDKAKIAKKIGNIKLAKWIKKDVHDTIIIEQYEEFRLGVIIHGYVKRCLKQHPSISFDELMTRLIGDHAAVAKITSKWVEVFKRVFDYYKSGKMKYK